MLRRTIRLTFRVFTPICPPSRGLAAWTGWWISFHRPGRTSVDT